MLTAKMPTHHGAESRQRFLGGCVRPNSLEGAERATQPKELQSAARDAQNDAVDEGGHESDPETRILERRPHRRYALAQLLDVTVLAIGADQGAAETGEFVERRWLTALGTVANIRIDAGGHMLSCGLL
jgi:hypothetical protein